MTVETVDDFSDDQKPTEIDLATVRAVVATISRSDINALAEQLTSAFINHDAEVKRYKAEHSHVLHCSQARVQEMRSEAVERLKVLEERHARIVEQLQREIELLSVPFTHARGQLNELIRKRNEAQRLANAIQIIMSVR